MMWKMAFRNLFRNKRRTIATSAAVVAGFVGLTLLGGYIIYVEKGLKSHSVYLLNKGHISIFKKEGLQHYHTRPSLYQLTPDDRQSIQKVLVPFKSSIEWTGLAISGSGLISNGEKSVPFLAVGVDLESLNKSVNHPQVLKWARDFLTQDSLDFVSAIQKDPFSISITSRLGEMIQRKVPFKNLEPEKKNVQLAGMDIFGDLNAVDATLSVSFSTGSDMLEDSGLLAPFELLQNLYGTDGAQYLMIYLNNDLDVADLTNSINQVFQTQNLPFEAYPFNDPRISANYVGSMGFLYAMAGFFVFLICGAVALSIVNSLTMGILERTREIGTFRAIGYRPQQLSWLMTQESLWLSLICAVAGVIISFVIGTIVNSLNIKFSPPGISSEVQFALFVNFYLVLLIAFLFFVLIGFTSYFVTHYKLKMKIVDLLSDSGS